MGVQLDVTCAADIEGVIKEAVAEYGKVDYFFNNAGVAVSGEVRDLELEHWKKVIDVNLFGVINGCHAVISCDGCTEVWGILSTSRLWRD